LKVFIKEFYFRKDVKNSLKKLAYFRENQKV